MFEWLKPIEMSEKLFEWHEAIGSLYAIIGIIAIIIAGGWTAMRYKRRREGKEKAILRQAVEIFKINSVDKWLVRVKVKVRNVGAVAVKPSVSVITINRVLPTTEEELKELIKERQNCGEADDTLLWEKIGERTQDLEEGDFCLEPGEESDIWSDFIISNEYEMIQVYSKMFAKKKIFEKLFSKGPPYRWDVVSFHKL